jgi:hypothetical protein
MVKNIPHYLLVGTILGGAFFFLWQVSHAATYLTRVSDLITKSAPGTTTSQTIVFTLNQAIPANGAIEVNFDLGGFTIPSALNFSDVDLGFSAVPGGPYTQRPLASVQTAGTDDVTVTSGSAGKIRIDLNTTSGIPAGNEVQIKIGLHASQGAIGDQQVTLASGTTTASYPITIYTYNASDIELDYGRTMIAVVPSITIGPVDTTDQIPPSITFAEPTGLLQVGTRGVQLFIKTDEAATCKYATSSMAYSFMPYSFTGTSTGFMSWHFAQETGLLDDTTYSYYIRCIDFRSNEMDPDYLLQFTIGIAPGSASSTATSTGTGGSGTGSSTASSTCTGTDWVNCVGTDTGSGSGSSGSGSGSSANGGDGAGGGGGGSGDSNPGTKLPQADVRIDGWAYPGSSIAFLRDGVLVATKGAGGGGEFSNLTEGLDRGSYNFSVYATDATGVRSATFATTLWLQASTLNTLSNIMLPPTVAVAENSIQPGSPLMVTGYSAPNAHITTWLRPKLAQVSSGDLVATTTASGNGAWTLTLSTTGLSQGTYELVAQGKMPNSLVESDKSARKTIGIGVTVSSDSCLSKGDLNCDGAINLVDFSILLFNWNTASAVADINGDGTVALSDFSIMLYNWTG